MVPGQLLEAQAQQDVLASGRQSLDSSGLSPLPCPIPEGITRRAHLARLIFTSKAELKLTYEFLSGEESPLPSDPHGGLWSRN